MVLGYVPESLESVMFAFSTITYSDITSALAAYWRDCGFVRVLFCSDCGFEAYLSDAASFAATVAECEFGDGGEGLDILHGFVFEGMSLLEAVAAYLDANCSIATGEDVDAFDCGCDVPRCDDVVF